MLGADPWSPTVLHKPHDLFINLYRRSISYTVLLALRLQRNSFRR